MGTLGHCRHRGKRSSIYSLHTSSNSDTTVTHKGIVNIFSKQNLEDESSKHNSASPKETTIQPNELMSEMWFTQPVYYYLPIQRKECRSCCDMDDGFRICCESSSHKTLHAVYDSSHTKYSSSTNPKKNRRKQQLPKMGVKLEAWH